MTIKYIEREDIDIQKYDACIDNSKQSILYAYSWYLDIVCDDWNCLVLDDYLAVMPIPWKEKYFIKYVYPPLWLLQLGIFSLNECAYEIEFKRELEYRFKFIELRLNSKNKLNKTDSFSLKNFQTISLQSSYKEIKKSFQSDRKKDLKKAAKAKLTILWNDSPQNLISLFKNNVGKRTPNIIDKDYENLQRLIDFSIYKGFADVLSVYDEKNQLVASAFFIKYQKEVTIVCSSTDFSNRKNGANTFLISAAIEKYHSEFDTFNFGGSSIPSIAKYFLSFGATSSQYPFLKVNKLPFFLRLLKA
tara:strand:+ start:4993 stop:5901 length:909 start_codon:yes stop_codon:yes gene_type:complete